MQPDKTIRQLVVSLLLLGWATSALALAAVPLMLSDWPWQQIGLSGLVALWGGAARTAQRAVSRRNDPDFALGRELMRDVVVSSLLGLLVYAYAAEAGWGTWRLAMALGAAGYGGSAVLDLALARLKTATPAH